MPRSRLLLVTVLGLTACNDVTTSGNGRGGGGAPAATTLTVTPSLGLVAQADVTLTVPGSAWAVASGTGSSGTAVFSVPPGLAGPFLVSVCGNDTATYFDEALGTTAPLGSGQCLRAMLPDLARTSVGVTPLTEAAVRYLERHGGLAAATPADVAAALDIVRSRLLPEVPSLLQAPALVAADTDLDNLPLDDGGRYALKLAALAGVARSLGIDRGGVDAPALAIADELADDLADGIFDGALDGNYLLSSAYDVHRLPGLLELQLGQFSVRSAGLGALVDSLGGQLPLAGLVPAAGSDPLPSWQGSYAGTWSNTSVFLGTFPVDGELGTFKDELVDGTSCPITITDRYLLIEELGFEFAFDAASISDAEGYRRYTFSRQGSATVIGFMGIPQTVEVTTLATLITQDGEVVGVQVRSDGIVLGIALNNIASGNCNVGAGAP